MGLAAAATAASVIGTGVGVAKNLGVLGGGSSGGGATGTAVGGAVDAAAQFKGGQIQRKAAEVALADQEKTTDKVAGQYDPYLALNAPTTTGLANLLGVGPQGSAGMLDQLQKTPGYQFVRDQGLQGVQSNYSKDGLAMSGAAMKGAAQYSSGLAETTYQNMVSNFINGGKLGLSGTDSASNIRMSGQNTSNALRLAAGKADASSYVGAGNVVDTTLNNLNALNPNNFTGNAAGGDVGTGAMDRLSAPDSQGYTTNDLAVQQPYQIQSPNVSFNTDPADNPWMQPINRFNPDFQIPSLPTG